MLFMKPPEFALDELCWTVIVWLTIDVDPAEVEATTVVLDDVGAAEFNVTRTAAGLIWT